MKTDRIKKVLPFNAMSCCENVGWSDKSSTADVNVIVLILLQDSYLPRILSEFGFTIGIRERLDAAVDTLRITTSALTWSYTVTVGSRSPAAHLRVTTLLVTTSKLTSFPRLLIV